MDQMLKMQGNIKKTIMGAVVRINHETTRFQHVNTIWTSYQPKLNNNQYLVIFMLQICHFENKIKRGSEGI